MPTSEETFLLLKEAEKLNKHEAGQKVIELLTENVLNLHMSAELYVERAKSWQELKQPDLQLNDLEQAHRINPDYFKLYYSRGNYWLNKKEYDKAIDDYSIAIHLNPNYPNSYINRGIIWDEKKEHDKAIDDYSKGIDLNPNQGISYINRGNSWQAKKEYDRAIDDYSKAISLNPKSTIGYFNRGASWLIQKEYDKAIDDLSKAIELDPSFASSYNDRGIAWHEKNEYGKAFDDFSKATDLDPYAPAPYFNLFALYSDTGQISLGLPDLNRANYLNYNKIMDLIKAYHQNFLSPFMLRRVLYRLFTSKDIYSFLGTYSYNEQYIKSWEMCLNLIDSENTDQHDTLNRLRLNALVNYFMGDCIESFRIYDNDIDSNDIYSFNLRDQYYYIKSAQEFLEPIDSILIFALQQADTDADKSIENCYYAGQLYLLNNEIKKAESFFIIAANSGFRPAMYQLVSLYNEKVYNQKLRNDICQSIMQVEEKDLDGCSLINGISPTLISDESDLLNNMNDLCKYYAYYFENIEEIQLVRDLLHINYPYKRTEFWELIQYSKETEEYFQSKVSHQELLEFEQKLFKAFDEYCKNEGETKFINRISDNNQALSVFKLLKNTVEDEDFKKSNLTYEKALAQKIKDMQREKIAGKWFLIFTKLLYLKNQLTIKEALTLHLYAEETAAQYKDKSVFNEINLEIQVWAKITTGVPSPLLTKLIFKTFQFIQNGFTFERAVENDYSDYLEFKRKYYSHLDSWKNILIKEFIEKSI